VTFCRSLNIPARYCTGYISGIGLPPPHSPGDFAAWMEVFLDGQWHTFDPRNNDPRNRQNPDCPRPRRGQRAC
jgi:transglutaminase-like putative cysteine protease